MKKGFNKCVVCGRWCNTNSYTTIDGNRVYCCDRPSCGTVTLYDVSIVEKGGEPIMSMSFAPNTVREELVQDMIADRINE